ncbi:unnamed protein product [Vitrella brassicaformis CCMP3155]|uniref:S-adenosyl-L-methionine-dependent methyltransferase n=2 Tax=Vitrella brassicaformis TaxID=1169539 RepID=A0A0G4ECF2_VITBC|nr:unnamed protein product [Vitrella brassicaformis CCMP3155]|eukprot:CEL93394.1 unnamed protein product [Vitrella brassicaformis CCMP3155]
MAMTHLPPPYDLPLEERKVIAAFITWKWWLYTRALMVLPKPAYKRLMAKANAKRWGIVAFVIARTKALDKICREAIEASTDSAPLQLVLLGAGYDTKFARLAELRKRYSVTMYEVDQKVVQDEKLRLMESPSISPSLYEDVRFVSCDFNTQSVDQVLVEAGFKKEVNTLFVWEGVTYYLSAQGVMSTLAAVQNLCANRESSIVFDYTDKCMTDSTTDDKACQSIVRALFNYKTPITWGIPKGEAAPFLKQHQWEVINHWTPVDLRDQYLRDENGEAFGESAKWFYMVHAKSIR